MMAFKEASTRMMHSLRACICTAAHMQQTLNMCGFSVKVATVADAQCWPHSNPPSSLSTSANSRRILATLRR